MNILLKRDLTNITKKNKNMKIKKLNEEISIDDEKSINRINKLMNFLYHLDDDSKVSAGDIFGYIKGYFDEDAEPDDEIEVFD